VRIGSESEREEDRLLYLACAILACANPSVSTSLARRYWQQLVNECSELARQVELCSLCYSSKKPTAANNEQKKLMLVSGGWRRDMAVVAPKQATPSLPKPPGAPAQQPAPSNPAPSAAPAPAAAAGGAPPPAAKASRTMSWGWEGDGTASAPPTHFSPPFSATPAQHAEVW
jgi:hypothetical protein